MHNYCLWCIPYWPYNYYVAWHLTSSNSASMIGLVSVVTISCSMALVSSFEAKIDSMLAAAADGPCRILSEYDPNGAGLVSVVIFPTDSGCSVCTTTPSGSNGLEVVS